LQRPGLSELLLLRDQCLGGVNGYLIGSAVSATAAAALTDEGVPVTYGRTIYLPVDETCFHLFEAPSLAAIEAVTARAELTVQRIARAIEQQ